MGRNLCCKKRVIRRSPWTVLEDNILKSFIKAHGERKWNSVPTRAGLNRCGKSCRLRWLNYLRPNIKRGNISPEEEDLIIRLHNLLGNRWALIAARLPGRTDNEIKNYWNTTLVKKATSGRAEAAVSTTYTAPMQTQMAVRTKAKRCSQQAPVRDSPLRLLRPPCPADDSIISSQVVLTPLSSTYPMTHDRSDHLLPMTIDPQVNAGLDSPNSVIVLEDRLGIKNTLDDCQGSNYLDFEPITFEEYWIASCCDVDHHI